MAYGVVVTRDPAAAGGPPYLATPDFVQVAAMAYYRELGAREEVRGFLPAVVVGVQDRHVPVDLRCGATAATTSASRRTAWPATRYLGDGGEDRRPQAFVLDENGLGARA
jgi:hypothetical protein